MADLRRAIRSAAIGHDAAPGGVARKVGCSSKRRSRRQLRPNIPLAARECRRDDAGAESLSLRGVSPRAGDPRRAPVIIHDPLNQLKNLRAALGSNGIVVADENRRESQWISSSWMGGQRKAQPGGDGVAARWKPGRCTRRGSLEYCAPRGFELAGDWVNNFNWVLSSSPLWKPLSPVIDSSILGWEAASVTPEFVIAGLPDRKGVRGRLLRLAQLNRGYLADLRQGPGRMLVTTFRFQSYGQDPFATMLLHQILIAARPHPVKTYRWTMASSDLTAGLSKIRPCGAPRRAA